MKKCFKCGQIKNLSDFYFHKGMADGLLNKCESCCRSDVRENRKKNIDHYREYDRARGNRQDKSYQENYKREYPNKFKAHNLVNSAIRSKKLFKEPCEICGTTESVHAHHDDYLKPLNIRWLCAVHHKEWHLQNGEGANAK